ncbi:heme exporter protein CcmD [Sphingoaurantiacus capsulatus]|uniref:Heme exporter protein D n=1 Tax=Sphingoaurantiacus capsulatus TaxID=1771310 RepID=A0ABV7X958_9SPHN
MAHAPFIIASYAIALGGVLGLLLVSYVSMRRAERQAEELRKGRRER